jgi:sterol desaturase/sphingolipid hydroxylase (fatty acid hydroxylase superfamily)
MPTWTRSFPLARSTSRWVRRTLTLRWRFPRLRWLIATPEFHHWHHASDAEGIDKNFAAFLPLWDRLFGTALLPAHWPQRYGTVGEPLPEGYLGQLAYPFRR